MTYLKRLLIFGPILFAIAVYIIIHTDTSSPPLSDDKRVFWACVQTIEKDLNNPSSSEIIPEDSYAYFDHYREVWVSNIYMRATNAFNAKIRAGFVCVARIDRDNDVRVIGYRQR